MEIQAIPHAFAVQSSVTIDECCVPVRRGERVALRRLRAIRLVMIDGAKPDIVFLNPG